MVVGVHVRHEDAAQAAQQRGQRRGRAARERVELGERALAAVEQQARRPLLLLPDIAGLILRHSSRSCYGRRRRG